jgi:hypothetical protein
VQQGFDLLWVQVTTCAECKKVSRYSLFWEGATNMVGKEPIEALTGIVFRIKQPLEEMFMKTCIAE